jgi:hypothetical protein
MTSWTCYSGSNNIHFNYPPIISDGRLFTSYQPEAVINERIQQSANINSNWSYRRYLQENGVKIMNYNNLEACSIMGLEQHTINNDTPSSNVPFKFKSMFDTSTPGFGYCNSDLKSPYLSREQLNSRLVTPSINPKMYQNK